MNQKLKVFETELQCDQIYEIEVTGPLRLDADLLEIVHQAICYVIDDSSYGPYRDQLGELSSLGWHGRQEEIWTIINAAGNQLDSKTITYQGERVRGDFFKRVNRILEINNVGQKILDDIDNRLASIKRNDVPKTGIYYVDVHPEVDWKPGEYHESAESCWWEMSVYAMGRSQFRHMCLQDKAFALRLYKLNKDEEFIPAGRCFAAKLDANSWGLFNAYGPNIYVFAEIFGKMTKMGYKVGEVHLNGNIYINNGTEQPIFSTDGRVYFSDKDWSDYDYTNMEFERDYKKYVDYWSTGLRNSGKFCYHCSRAFFDGTELRRRTSGDYWCPHCVDFNTLTHCKHDDTWLTSYEKTRYQQVNFQYEGVIYENDWVREHVTEYTSCKCIMCRDVYIYGSLDHVCLNCKGKENERTTKSANESYKNTVRTARYWRNV